MERTYTIPLRRQWSKTVAYKRGKKTIRAIREFMVRHMKATEVKIGKFLNEEVWKHGIRNPPSRIRVNAKKEADGVVTVELFGKPMPSKEAQKPKEKKSAQKPESESKAPAKEAKAHEHEHKGESKSESAAPKKKAAEKKSGEHKTPAEKSSETK